tara:strand:- start:2806 stop:3198 length:393 start_codon:yes stop_codon:yes gene_type:complete
MVCNKDKSIYEYFTEKLQSSVCPILTEEISIQEYFIESNNVYSKDKAKLGDTITASFKLNTVLNKPPTCIFKTGNIQNKENISEVVASNKNNLEDTWKCKYITSSSDYDGIVNVIIKGIGPNGKPFSINN